MTYTEHCDACGWKDKYEAIMRQLVDKNDELRATKGLKDRLDPETVDLVVEIAEMFDDWIEPYLDDGVAASINTLLAQLQERK